MKEYFSRTECLLNSNNMDKLSSSHVAIFGVGGVGGYVIEALVRCGIKNITIIDNDVVSLTNINRQIIALKSTVGRKKVEVMKERILDINEECNVFTYDTFVLEDNIDTFDFSSFDYVVDAIDTVSAKLAIIEKCNKNNIPIISSMGTGNKLDPSKFEIVDINQTSVCPLARVMRRELKKRNISKLKVLFSKEEPHSTFVNEENTYKNNIPGSISFVPSSAGLLIASFVVKELIK